MTLYRMELDDEFGEPYYQPASLSDLLAAVAEHIDYEAAEEELGRQLSTGEGEIHGYSAKRIVDAALGLPDKETNV